jgi:hypothetical protein
MDGLATRIDMPLRRLGVKFVCRRALVDMLVTHSILSQGNAFTDKFAGRWNRPVGPGAI